MNKWNDIKEYFTDGLLLGNGASMAVHQGFGYSSLFEAARQNGHLTAQVAAVFNAFGTRDFELVLRRLWQAKIVNTILSIPAGKVEESYLQVRTALIATVRDVHISHEEALKHLTPIYTFMSNFKTVVSLNYDLLVYWAVMQSREELKNWLKDCFGNGGIFLDDWKRLRERYNADGSTLVFYPHGNLMLARDFNGIERKISTRGYQNLLGQILDEWESGATVPLFVCDGTSEQKLNSICSSSYLQRTYLEVIPSMNRSLVIFGWAIGDQETHILKKIKQANPTCIAVSVYCEDKLFMQHVQKRLQDEGLPEPYFFDSASPGCWNTPES